MSDELQRKDGLQRKFLAHTAKPRRPRAVAQRLMWTVFQECVSTGVTPESIAAKHEVSPGYARWMVWKARGIMLKSKEFNPDAANIHAEMMKFLPLAAHALETNLIEADPKVTVAFLQGVGALIPKAEITHLSEEERQAALVRSTNAINPKLRKALDITEHVVIEDEKKKPL